MRLSRRQALGGAIALPLAARAAQAEALPPLLPEIRPSLHDNHFRVSPSVHNDQKDIERLLAALPRV